MYWRELESQENIKRKLHLIRNQRLIVPPKKTVKQEREEKVEKCVNILKKKHGTTFSQMQYRIWAEMVANEMHSDTDTPPSSSMFKRAGDGGGSSGKRSDSTGITKALT